MMVLVTDIRYMTCSCNVSTCVCDGPAGRGSLVPSAAVTCPTFCSVFAPSSSSKYFAARGMILYARTVQKKKKGR